MRGPERIESTLLKSWCERVHTFHDRLDTGVLESDLGFELCHCYTSMLSTAELQGSLFAHP